MQNTSRRTLLKIEEFLDAGILCGSFVFTVLLIGNGAIPDPRSLTFIRLPLTDVALVLTLALLWHKILAGAGFYHSKRLDPLMRLVFDIVKTMVVVTLLGICAAGLFGHPIRLASTMAFYAVSTALLIGLRAGVRAAQILLRLNHRNLRRLLIIGSNERALSFARTVLERRDLGYILAGFADDEWEGINKVKSEGFALICTLDGVADYLRLNHIDEVFLALPLGSHYTRIEQILRLCDEQGITVRYPSTLCRLENSRPQPEHIGDTSTILLHAPGIRGLRATLKRLFDVFLSFTLLVILSPLLAAIALAVKMTSPGPVIFRQKRLGLNKRIFTMYKFRTMVADAERLQKDLEHRNEAAGPVFKIKDDPRITPLGKFLRRTSIDELPQLFNVLVGDMSIIGPRPLPLRDYYGFDTDAFRRRLSVKPGITCIWQATGRSAIAFDQWMLMDLDYIDRWSMALDMRILWRTFFSVVRGVGAV